MYSFLVISRCLRNCCKENENYFFDKLLEKEYLFSFEIHFILNHQELTRPHVFQFKYSCFNGRRTVFEISLIGLYHYLH